MNILETRSIEIASLALDGLATRHKAITSNIANADSADYKKVDVNFENQLQRIITTEDKKEQHKLNNMFNEVKPPMQVTSFDLQYSDFNPEFAISDKEAIGKNNVNLESEMAHLAKNGIKYNALATLQHKSFQGLNSVIQQGGRI